jgi:hypothetical protein
MIRETELRTYETSQPSPVRIAAKVFEIAAISSDSPGIAASFLCNKDWVAERVGFDNRELCYLSSFEEHQP